jgi:putative transposase
MKSISKRRRKAKYVFEEIFGTDEMQERFAEVLASGKQALDHCMMEVGKSVAQAMMQWDRESISGSDYAPIPGYHKWGWQSGSIYLGDRKVKLQHPRLRQGEKEVLLKSYERMKNPKEFSEELLIEALRGISVRKYQETVTAIGQRFGVSPGSVSNRLLEATGRKLKSLRERALGDFELFALFLDTVHRGGEVLFVTDGGKGIRSALKDRLGKDLIHQRCTIHKDRNIQNHLPKRYRNEAHRRYRNALELKVCEEAKKEFGAFEAWLRKINESAATSLLEAQEELLTLHRLKVPALLRKRLHSTNPIESLFSTVRHCEKNIKRYRGSQMSGRWLAAVALHAEQNFRRIKGYQDIAEVIAHIKQEQTSQEPKQKEVLKAA